MAGGYIAEDDVISLKRNPWADNFFRPLLITIMIMCLSISLVNLVNLVNPAWRGTYFLVGMFITTVEAIYSYRVLRHYRSRGVSLLRYRLAEAALLILILRILGFMDTPLANLGAELQAMWHTPAIVFNPEFYTILFLAFMAWMAATYTIADLESLHDPYLDNRATLGQLTERFFWGGIILVVISGITLWTARAGASALLDWQRPALGGIVLNVLIYFMLGLGLLSQINLTRHLLRWRLQKIAVTPGLVKQWAKYGLVFLSLISLIAFMLPTSYSMGLLTAAAFFVLFIIGIIVFISQLIVLLILLTINWLLSFLGTSTITETPAPPPPPPLIPPGNAVSPASWLEVLQSLLFWLVILATLAYLLKIYIEDHPEIFNQLKKFRPMALLFNLAALLWQTVTGWVQAGWDMVPKTIKRGDAKSTTPSVAKFRDWLGLRHLSPRERILYYYLNTLKRAEKAAPARKQHQTPYEYESGLSEALPGVQPEIHELTDIFVHARYSRQAHFTENQAMLVKVIWQRIRKAMRQATRPQKPPEPT